MMSTFWGLGFFPSTLPCIPFVGQLQKSDVKQITWIDLGAGRVPRLLKIKGREQNTFPPSNLLL